MPDRLGQLFQDPNWRVKHSSIDTFGALVQFGTYLYFCGI